MMLAAVLMFLVPRQQETPQLNPVLDALKFLLSHQREEGSWGAPPPACTCRPAGAPAPREGDLESTAWAILAFSGAGYTEGAVDEFNGRNVGKAVRSALDWLVSKQDKEGAFDRSDPAVNAIAALALTETYGRTVQRKEAAEKAYFWVEKSAISDVVGRIRQGMVLQSGKVSELGHGHAAKILALGEALEKQDGDLARWGSLLLKGFALHGKPNKPGMKLALGDPLRIPAETLNVFASASFILGHEEEWHVWFRGLKDVLFPLQRGGKDTCEAGSWDGETLRDRVRATAMRCLTVQHYRCFYCRNVFRQK